MEVTSKANLVIGLKDEASAQARKLAQDLARLQHEVAGVGRAASQVAGSGGGLGMMNGQMKTLIGSMLGATGIITSVGALGTAMVQTAQRAMMLGQEAETTAQAFTTMLGSTEAATAHLKELREFAAKTPFEFRDLVNSSKQLQAFGFEAAKIVPMLRDIGDTVGAMGGSAEMIDRITRALGQMSAKGKVSGEELLQMTEQGVPALQYLASHFGLTTGEMQKMVSKGLVPAAEGIQAILDGMRKDFGGMMAKQADTATGKLSNLQDAWDSLLTTIGAGTVEATGVAAVAMTNLLGNYNTALTANLNSRSNRFGGERDEAKMLFLWSSILNAVGDTKGSIDAAAQATKILEENTAQVRNKMGWTPEVESLTDGLIEGKEAMKAMEQATLDAATAQTKLEQEFNATKIAVENLSLLMDGPMGKQMESNAEKTADLKQQQADLRAEIDKLTASHGQYWENVEQSGDTQAELTLKTLQLQKAQQDLGEAMAATGEEFDPLRVAQLNVQIERLQGELTGATTVTSGFIDNSKKIAELTGDYDAVTQAIRDQAAEHDEATKRIIFNILQQQLANRGLTEEAGPQLLELARQWGLIDQATYDASVAMMSATREAVESNDMNILIARANEYKDALNGIPTQLKTTITLEERRIQYNQVVDGGRTSGGYGADQGGHGSSGTDYTTPGSGGNYGGGYGGYQPPVKPEEDYDGKEAFGGPMHGGGTYLTQESIYTRPEVFIPGTSGAMLTRQQMAALGMTGGTDNAELVTAIRTLPATMAREVKQAIQFALSRMS